MKKILGLSVGAIAWFALVAQFIISIQLNVARGDSVAFGIWMYFAFFTVTTNLLVALMLTLPALAPRSRDRAIPGRAIVDNRRDREPSSWSRSSTTRCCCI